MGRHGFARVSRRFSSSHVAESPMWGHHGGGLLAEGICLEVVVLVFVLLIKWAGTSFSGIGTSFSGIATSF